MFSLRTKILAVAAALVLLSQIGTVSIVLLSANKDVSQRASRSLQTGMNVLRKAASSRAAEFENTVRALASDYGFKQAVGTGDSLTVESALANHLQRAGADIALLIDRDQQVLAKTSSANSLFDIGDDQLIDEFFEATGRRSLVVNGAVYEVFTVPVRAPLPIAWMTMGFRLTDTYAEQLKDLTNLDVTIFASTLASQSLMATSMNQAFHSSLNQAATRSLSGTGPATIDMNGAQYLAVMAPLLNRQPDVQVLLTKSLTEAMAPYELLKTASFALGALPLLAALLGAILLSRALTQPVQKLMEAAKRIRSGDYDTPVDIRSGDELNQFGVAFNAMQVEIATREQRIRYQASHDSVTGLLNAEAALAYLHEQIELAGKSKTHVVVMLIALNAQTDISGSLGHDVADTFLKRAADNLARFVDSSFVLARLENDRFLVIFTESKAMRAREVAQDLHARLATGISLPAINVALTPTIGVAVVPDHAMNAEQALQRATIANSESGAAGRPVRFYQEGDEEQLRRNMTLLQDLRRAADENEFRMHCQPKIHLATEKVCGVEALIRWEHPVYGWLPPDEFIPLIEHSGNISILTRWALEHAIKQQAQWSAKGFDIVMAVNLSSQDLLDADLPWFIIDLIKHYQLSPQKLLVEITEEAMVRDFANAIAVLERLHDLGIKIAIDDFGTGYSSLEQLKHLPVDQLKIDKSFVAHLPDDPADVAIVSTTIELAHRLGLEIVAEGVENGTAMRWLRDHGVDQAQGYYWSRPIPADEISAWAEQFSGGNTCEVKSLKLV